MSHVGGHRPILLIGLFLVRGVLKFVVPVLYWRIVGGEFFVPVFCVGRGGTESGRTRGWLIIVFKIVVPVLGGSTFGRGTKAGALLLGRLGGGPRLINEVIVPILGRVAFLENAFGRRYPRICTVEVEILVPILGVAGCRNVGKENVRVRLGPVTDQQVFGPLLPSVQMSNTLETPCGCPSVEGVYVYFAGRRGGDGWV